MEKLAIDFNGFIEVDKNNLVLQKINENTGEMMPVNVNELTSDEIIEGIQYGDYYLSFESTYKMALNGDLKYDVEISE